MRYAEKPIVIDGVSRTASQWAKISGLSKNTIAKRRSMGWDARRCVFADSRLGHLVKKARQPLPPPVPRGISTFPMGSVRSFPLEALEVLRRVA